MPFPFTQRWRDERRQRRETDRKKLLAAAKERVLRTDIAAAEREATAAKTMLDNTSPNSPEWATRNNEWIVANAKHQQAQLNLSAWRANNSFVALDEAGKKLSETTKKFLDDMNDSTKKK